MRLKKIHSLLRSRKRRPSAADAFEAALRAEEAAASAAEADLADNLVRYMVATCLPDHVGEECAAFGVGISQSNIHRERPCVRCGGMTEAIQVSRPTSDILTMLGRPPDSLAVILYTLCRGCHEACDGSDFIAAEVGEKVMRMAVNQETVDG